MLGSPNAGFFTDDGDQSGPPGQGIAFGDVPEGSAGIERTLSGYLEPGRQAARRHAVEHPDRLPPVHGRGRADRGHEHRRIRRRKPLCKLACGAVRPVSGSIPTIQSPRDTVDNINREALAVMGSGVAFAVGSYAESISGVNGVPPHDKRHRTRVP